MTRSFFFIAISIFVVVAASNGADLQPQDVTDFASLEKLASQMAHKPYKAPATRLDPFFDHLKYDGHRQIEFREDKSLYSEEGKESYRVQFFHPGWMFKKPVEFHSIEAGKAAPVPFDASLFNYRSLVVPPNVKKPVGYAGFKVLAPNALLGRNFEFMVFMGASYYRVAPTELVYGISARGVAVNTIGGKPEEFPDFSHFWFHRPKAGDEQFRLLALLNGPSITGAYEFDVAPGKVAKMRVKATLFLRKAVEMLGIAPFSSMFWYGENSNPKPYDFRPEVHDSDGLQVEIEGGPAIWRPLDVSRDTRLSLFQTDKLKGFGLAKRDRDFDHFQDLEAHYHKRPSVWVEPVKGFEKGSVTLLELATGEETWDNIVAMWQPAALPTGPDQPLNIEYNLSWLDLHEPGTLAKVLHTRRGFAMDSDDHLYVIDFSEGAVTKSVAKDWQPEVDLVIGDPAAAKVMFKNVIRNPESGGWRAFFRLDVPDKTNLMELTCELKDKEGKPVSERWSYQWRR